MNRSRYSKPLAMVLSSAALMLAAGAAHAGGVNWSIGINLPPVGTVISNGPVYPSYPVAPVYGPPVAYYPPPVVYRPAPAYYPPPVIYRPAPRYYGPPAVVVDRRWGPAPGHWDHRHGGQHEGWRGEGHRGRDWDRGERDDRGRRH